MAVDSAEPQTTKSDLSHQLRNFHGKVSLAKAVPYGIQHVLTMFVSNLAPILLICAAAGFDASQTTMLVQNAMVVAGIGTLIQLFGVWKMGARMPIVMGTAVSFTSVLCAIAASQGYGVVVGAVIIGGIVEGFLGLAARHVRKLITPVVSAVVVISIGLSLLNVGAKAFGGGAGAEDFATWPNMVLGLVSLVSCLVFMALAKGSAKQLAVLFGMAVGYVVALFFGKVDFSAFLGIGAFSLPNFMPFIPEFDVGAIISVILLYLVSMADTIGDTAAVAQAAFGRAPSAKEYQGALVGDGWTSAIAGLFGCMPLDSFAQNIGLITITRVVNRRAIASGAVLLVLGGFVPFIAAVFGSLPDAVLGGCTIMMFGSVAVSGFQMLSRAGFSQRNIMIAALSLGIGVGFTQVSGMFGAFPEVIQSIFATNSMAVTFVVAVVLNLVLPRDAHFRKMKVLETDELPTDRDPYQMPDSLAESDDAVVQVVGVMEVDDVTVDDVAAAPLPDGDASAPEAGAGKAPDEPAKP